MALVFSLFVLIPPVKVEVPDPVTAREVDVALVVVARVPIRLVIVPLVAVRVVELNEVEVELVVVEFNPVKFWRVVEARESIPFVTVRRPLVSNIREARVDVA